MLLPEFEQWCDRQPFTPEDAEKANLVLRFLKMPVVPRALLEAFAEAVRGLPYETSAEPLEIVGVGQSESTRKQADQGVSRPGRQRQ